MSPACLQDFAGRWRMRRRIEGRIGAASAGSSASFDGIATFTPTKGGLEYAEAGELRLPEQGRFHATRRYLWRPVAGGVDVCFADGSAFHHFDLGLPVVCTWHDCLPDVYEVSYNFTHWPDWRAIGVFLLAIERCLK